MTGSGKSTFAYRYMVNAPVVCRFLFDDLGRHSTRLNIRPASTAAELEAALQTRWVLFRPHRMFPDGNFDEAFSYFCKWALEASQRGPGRKIFHADEIWQYQSNYTIPPALSALYKLGREENVEVLAATQEPHKLNATLLGQNTEVVSFYLDEPLSLDKLKGLGFNPDEIRNLPLGKFIAINRLSKCRLSGTVFKPDKMR